MPSKLRLPSLHTILQDAHRNGAVANRFRVTPEEADRIRRAEQDGGRQAGLRAVLLILREKQAQVR